MPYISALLLITAFLLPSAVIGDRPLAERNSWIEQRTWPAFATARQIAVADKDEALTKLLKKRYNAALDDLRDRYSFWLQGADTMENLVNATRRVATARLELETSPAERLQILKERFEFFNQVVSRAGMIWEKEQRTQGTLDLKLAKHALLDAEIELLRAEQENKRPATK